MSNSIKDKVQSELLRLRALKKRTTSKEKREIKSLENKLRKMQLETGETITFFNENGSITLALDYYINLSQAQKNKLKKAWR